MNVRPNRIALRLALCAVLVTGAVAASAGPASAVCETVYVDAYNVELEIPRDVYRAGETVRVEAMVTRKDTGMPVADASFVAVLFFEDAIVLDMDVTDIGGRAVAHLKLKKKHVDPGPVPLLARAQVQVADAQCAALVEYGEKRLRKAFTIKP